MPLLPDTETALECLAEWGRQYELPMARREPLIRAALAGPLSGRGDLRRAERATGPEPTYAHIRSAGSGPEKVLCSSAISRWGSTGTSMSS